MKKFLLIFLFFLAITIWSNVHCPAQTTDAKTDNTAQQAQTVRNAPAGDCYLCYLKEKPFAHWETWVTMLVIFIISGLVSISEWKKEGTGDPNTAGCLLFIFAIIGFILDAILAGVIYESFLVFLAFCISCVLGIGFLGQAIAGHRNK